MFTEQFRDMNLSIIKENSKNFYVDIYKDRVKVHVSLYFSDQAVFAFLVENERLINSEQHKLEELKRTRKRIVVPDTYRKIDQRFIHTSSDKISSNDIYKISMTQFIELYNRDETFRKEISSGRYTYIDGFICIDNEKYIERVCGKVSLRDYGIKHKDECCISFTTKLITDKEEKVLGSVPKSIDEEISRAKKKSEELKKYDIPLAEFIRDKMKTKGITVEQAAENSFLIPKTVDRLRKKDSASRSTIQTLLGLACGLELSLIEVEMLIKKGGYAMRKVIPQEDAYISCFIFCETVPLEEINACLVKFGYTPWGSAKVIKGAA